MNKAVSSFAKTFLAVFFIAITAVSCSDDEIPPLFIDELGDVHMKFLYNGTTYNSPNPLTFNLGNKTIDATYGSGSNQRRITLFMPLNPTVGTHFMTEPLNNDSYGAYFISGSTVDMVSDSGTMTITHVTDDYVKGTFTFSGQNGAVTVSITNGSFLADK